MFRNGLQQQTSTLSTALDAAIHTYLIYARTAVRCTDYRSSLYWVFTVFVRGRGGYPLLEFIFFGQTALVFKQELDLSFSTVFFFLQTDTVVLELANVGDCTLLLVLTLTTEQHWGLVNNTSQH